MTDLWQSVVEDGGGLVLILDVEGRIVFANRIFAGCFATTPAQLVGRSLHELIPPESVRDRLRLLEQALSTRRGVSFKCLFQGQLLHSVYRPILPSDGSAPRLVLVVARLASSLVDGFEDATEEKVGLGDCGVLSGLTTRELDVLRYIGEGYSTAEIAERMFRTIKTIEAHRAALGRKLGVKNRVQLARIAIQANLVGEQMSIGVKPKVKTRRDGISADKPKRDHPPKS